MSLGDLDILAAASWELLTTTLANMPESQRGRRVIRLPRPWRPMLPKSASGLNRRSLEGLTRYGKRNPRIRPKNLDRSVNVAKLPEVLRKRWNTRSHAGGRVLV
jgi:hypothetical protein